MAHADTLGVAHAPGYWATPTNHGFGISKTSKSPDLAWAFVKHLTGNRWATEFSRRRKLLTGNIAADTQGLELMRKEDPLAAQVLQTQLEHTDKFCGDWTLPVDAQLKDAFYPEIQNAIFGCKGARRPSTTLSAVNRVLSKRG
jgi:ABC-type glycerol-3-phosphate transport system substrate-binding protein